MAKHKKDFLTARWDAIPSERQEAYRRIYQSELRQAGATTDDAAELAVLQRLITAYKEQGLVPIGSRWASVPQRVRRAARRGHSLHGVDHTPSSRVSKAAILLLIPLAGLLILALMSFTGGDNNENATLTPELTPTVTVTPTPENSPTPTPLALEASDRFIESGQTSNRDYFPVLLQVYPADGTPARVFVVQERDIDTADWRYSNNPDVASWVSGLVVRPVLGLPFSEENADLMAALEPGSHFTLQMNTGAVLEFIYADTTRVIRQQTDVFQQEEPGIILILIGETNSEGLLTEERLIVTGHYPIEQEVERLLAGELSPVIASGQPGTLVEGNGLQMTTLSTNMIVNDSLPDDLAYALVDVDVINGSDPLRTSGLRWLLEDPTGNRYSPDVNATEVGTFAPLPGEMEPHSGLQTSIGFLVPRTLTTAQILVSLPGETATPFALTFEPPPIPGTIYDLDVQVLAARYTQSEVHLDLRVFNPLDTAILLTNDVPRMVLGYTSDPIGPQHNPQSNTLNTTIPPGTAIDASLTFPYGGEPYAHLSLLGREYALSITEGG